MCKKSGDVKRLNAFFNALTSDLESALPPATGADRFALERLLSRMRKRAKIGGRDLHNEALMKFRDLNTGLAGFTPALHDDVRFHAAQFIRETLERYIKGVYPDSLQECFSWTEIMEHWAFGPGASYGLAGLYGTVSKIDSPMRSTHEASSWVKRLRQTNPYFQCFDALNEDCGVVLAPGSSLTTVPKNESTMRTIAIEPSGNMAFQLAGGRVIEAAMRRIGLDIKDQQEKNKNLARIASRDGHLCTLDLKSASDMFTPVLIRQLWPAEWCTFFEKFRSPCTQITKDETIALNMISTMGNGFTFPMMTLTLVALVYANRLVNHNGPFRFVDWRCTAVFGDDIIVPVTEYDTLCEVLTSCGLVVNHDKSYKDGPFRESCGGDYWEGVLVTPFYVKSLATAADVYVAINQVLHFCGRHNMFFVRALKYLIALCDGNVFLVPEWCQDTAGIRTAQCPAKYKMLQTRKQVKAYHGFFTMPLACGGYLTSKGDGTPIYEPRPRFVKYGVTKARLPSGYRDGWDPGYRTCRQASHVSLLVSMLV